MPQGNAGPIMAPSSMAPAAVAPATLSMANASAANSPLHAALLHPGQVFEAMDGGSVAVSGSMVPHAPGAASLSVGYQDARLGYVELQARQVAGSIQATLIPSSEAAQHALQGQLGALGGWLAQRATPVERLAVVAPAAMSSLAGNMGGQSQGGGDPSSQARSWQGNAGMGNGQGNPSGAGAGFGGGQDSPASGHSSGRLVEALAATGSVVSHSGRSVAEPVAGLAMGAAALSPVSGSSQGTITPASVGRGQRISVHA